MPWYLCETECFSEANSFFGYFLNFIEECKCKILGHDEWSETPSCPEMLQLKEHLHLGGPSVEPGAGFDGACGFLPTRILYVQLVL